MVLNYLATILIALLVAYFLIRLTEFVFVLVYRRPVYRHFYFRLHRISTEEEDFLYRHFSFYTKLSKREKRYFQHRLAEFMKEKDFEGRGGFEITQEVKLMVAATAVMLTFGLRNYYLGILQKIIIYPHTFYSYTCGGVNKGEFNPLMKVLVLSWEHFRRGFLHEKGKANLGIHEFTHVLQMNSQKFSSIGTTVFLDENQGLEDLLKDKKTRLRLAKTHLFRKYAYTNRFEFLAVLVEIFIESPKEFKEEFPKFYFKIKRMLNFNFAGY